MNKRGAARVGLAVAAGIAVGLVFSGILMLVSFWMVSRSGYQPPSGFWIASLIRLFVTTIPMYGLSCLAAVFLFSRAFKPKTDDECRCRKCGYILRGLSRPECPECGEGI